MKLTAVKHFLCSAALGAFCITFLSGCIAMNLERPLSYANEVQDENLEGVWVVGSSSKDAVVFEIKNIENHHYSLLWMLPNRGTFTISQIPDGKGNSYRFASIICDNPGDPQKNESCTLVRYESSPDQIGIYNVTSALQEKEDYKKLCTDPEKKELVTAGSDAVRKWCGDHAKEMELIFILTRVRFKSDAARRNFLDMARFFHEHTRRMAVILAGAEHDGGELSKAQQRKIGAEFETVKKWLSDSQDMISPELAVIFESYLSMQLGGKTKKETVHDVDVYTQMICRIAYLQLLK